MLNKKFSFAISVAILSTILSADVILAKDISGSPENINKVTSNNIVNNKSEEDKRISKYVILDNDNNLYFNIKKATENNESNIVIEIGKIFNEFSYDMSYNKEVALQKLRSLPIWGNWCGPGYGSGDPIDLLDEGCMQHDNCYVHGGNNCKCNKKLIKYIDDNVSRMTSGQALMARAIKIYFTVENFSNKC